MTVAELIKYVNANPLTDEQIAELNESWKKETEAEIEREFWREQARIKSLDFTYSL